MLFSAAALVGTILNNILNNEEAFSLGRGVRGKGHYPNVFWNRIFTPTMSRSMANQGNKSPLPALLKIDQAITFNFRSKDLWNMSVMSLVDT